MKVKKILSIIINLSIVIMEIIAMVLSFRKNNISMITFYTEDSNLFTMVVCAIMAIATIISMKKQIDIPKWVQTLKYMATCCLTLTIIVVVVVLAPMIGENGYKFMLLKGSMLYHHLICPILAIISFAIFDDIDIINYKQTILAMIPTCLYAIIIITLNILKIITGPYPFLKVYEQPVYISIIWFIVILIGAYIIALLLRQLSKIIHKKIYTKI